MAKVTEGFLLGTYEGLTFYLLHGKLCVRRKSTLSRQRVKFSPRFKRTRQSADELGRASKMASRVYRELTREQKQMVYALFKKMTGVAKIALKWGKSEGEAEGAVRQFLIEMGVVKEKAVGRQQTVRVGNKGIVKVETVMIVMEPKEWPHIQRKVTSKRVPKVYIMSHKSRGTKDDNARMRCERKEESSVQKFTVARTRIGILVENQVIRIRLGMG